MRVKFIQFHGHGKKKNYKKFACLMYNLYNGRSFVVHFGTEESYNRVHLMDEVRRETKINSFVFGIILRIRYY